MKLRNIILVHLFLLFFINNSNAQFINITAVEEVIRADSLFKIKNYKRSIKNYQQAVKRDFFPKSALFEMIAKSFHYSFEKDSALFYMAKSIASGKINFEGDTMINNVLLHDTSGNLIKKMEENEEEFFNSEKYLVYSDISDSLVKRKKLDQKYRFGKKGKKTKEEWNEQKNIDRNNQIFLTEIIMRIGKWPGRKEVGREAERVAFLIAQHSEDSIFQLQCLKLLKEEVLSNNMSLGNYGLLVDRYLLITKGFQCYGTQLESVEKDGKKIAVVKGRLFNKKYVNTLRLYFELPLLSFYLKDMTDMYNK